MAYVKFDPVREFENMSRFMEKVAKEVSDVRVETGAFRPRVDIMEMEKNYLVLIELPGLAKEDVKISVNDERVMTISGSKKAAEHQGMKLLRNERVFGEFKRSLHLPETTDIENISAKFDNGVLNLEIPKKEPEKPKEKEVNIN